VQKREIKPTYTNQTKLKEILMMLNNNNNNNNCIPISLLAGITQERLTKA
jgi:hypothetical protein